MPDKNWVMYTCVCIENGDQATFSSCLVSLAGGHSCTGLSSWGRWNCARQCLLRCRQEHLLRVLLALCFVCLWTTLPCELYYFLKVQLMSLLFVPFVHLNFPSHHLLFFLPAILHTCTSCTVFIAIFVNKGQPGCSSYSVHSAPSVPSDTASFRASHQKPQFVLCVEPQNPSQRARQSSCLGRVCPSVCLLCSGGIEAAKDRLGWGWLSLAALTFKS